MNNQELLKKLRDSLENSVKKFLKFAASDMTQLTTKDGDVLYIDGTDLAVGISVYMTDENGNITPVEDGDYSFEDGRDITITGGKISNISGSPATREDTTTPETEMAKEELATDGLPDAVSENPEQEDTKADEELSKQIADLTARIDAIEQLLQTNTMAAEQLMSKIEKLSKEPAAEPIRIQKTSDISSDQYQIIEKYKKIFREQR